MQSLTVFQDDSFTVIQTNLDIDGSPVDVGVVLESVSSFTTTSEQTHTIKTSVSVGVEAGFSEIFSASVMTTVTSSESEISSESIQVVNSCGAGQQCEVFWTPMINTWQGYLKGAGDLITVIEPVPNSRGHYTCSCEN
jgi:hypothetical protein